MKKAILVSASALALAACGQVHPGHVGIKVNQFGSGAGVQSAVLGVGTYFTPMGTHIYEYPVYTNTYTFTRSENEGGHGNGNEEFAFQDKSGLGITADVGVSFSVDPEKAAVLFQKYRVPTDQIIAGPLRNAIRDSLINRASGLDVNEIYGPKKTELLSVVQGDVQRFFQPYGLRVEKLFWAGNVRPPENVLQQINQRVANEQAALAAQAQVATKEAEAKQQVAEAQGKAQALDVEGAAIRANPEVLRIRAIEKWDGKMPQVIGGSGAMPFINVGSEK